MKKGFRGEGNVLCVDFPNKGIVVTDEGEQVIVKNSIPGQRVAFACNKARHGKYEGRLLEVVKRSDLERPQEECCPHFGICGGCAYQSIPYEKQLEIKESQVRKLISDAIGTEEEAGYEFMPIKGSPVQSEYRNKMEFTFGDEYKDGPLALGMHKRGSFYDIVTVKDCEIIDADFRLILKTTCAFFEEKHTPYFHRMSHEGYLRHLLVRKAVKTGEILIDLVTTTAMDANEEAILLDEYRDTIVSLSSEGKIKGTLKGLLHTKNDSIADVVKDEGTEVLFGEAFFYEELMGLRFQISPFSFFQTNSLGAEVLYETARDFIREAYQKENPEKMQGATLFDLYSGTGTIAQMMAPACKHVVGVEIIEEAVEAAKENAKLNNLENCEFLAGDVLKVLDEIKDKPDFIILDPPRDGIHPKALEKIIDYGVDSMIYISCKPTSLARDLEVLTARGYRVQKVVCVDMFPNTYHVESIALLERVSNRKADA